MREPVRGDPALGRTCLLPAGRYVLDVRQPPAVAAASQPCLRGGDSRPVVPCALLLSRACDRELGTVARLLGRAGVPVMRLNADEAALTAMLVDPDRGTVRLGGRRLAPTVVWVRHFSSRAVQGPGDPAGDEFARDSWASAAGALAALATVSIPAGRPGLLAQQRAAASLGIAVPRTVLATDAGAAARVIGAPRLIVKAAHLHFVEADPGLLTGFFPVVKTASELAQWRTGPPVIVQEYLEHDGELRVYWADGRLEAFSVGKRQPADPWLAPGRVSARPAAAPAAVVSATRRLAAALSLRYGAFDFLLHRGEPVFLEVNPDGDWRWIEAMAGTLSVSMAVAQMLCRLHRRARPAPTSAGPQPGNAFGLLRFLAG